MKRTAAQSWILVIVLLGGAFVESGAYFPDSAFIGKADSIFNLSADSQITERQIKKDQHTYFMVTTCKTIRAPYDSVVTMLKNIPLYPDYFTFITKAEKVTNKNTPTDTVIMFVGGYGLYRVYFFGKIREEYRSEQLSFRIFCGNADQKPYRKTWKKKVKGLIKIGSHDVDIFWTAEKRSDSTTRISLTASQAFAAPIANWMISIGTNRIFRGMLKDIEKYFLKTAAAEANATSHQTNQHPSIVLPALDTASIIKSNANAAVPKPVPADSTETQSEESKP